MRSDLFKLNLKDVGKALLFGVVGALFLNLYQQWGECALIASCYDIGALIEAGISFMFTYMMATFFTDNSGKLGGAL